MASRACVRVGAADTPLSHRPCAPRVEARAVNRLAVLLLALGASPSFSAEKPRLGVVIVIDQLSAQRFRARLPLVTGGFKRLTSEGYVFHEARYEAIPTITSVGHATLMTGAYGELHGIVSNDWLDTATGKPQLSTEDAKFKVLGRDAHGRDGTAPTSLRVPTLADAVKGADEKALALSVSGKDRSAILCAGRAGLAVWFDAELPFFTTSTFYAKALPPFLAPTNERLSKQVLSGAFAWGLPGGGITGQAPRLPSRTDDSEPLAERPEIQDDIDTAEVDVALDGVKALGLGRDDVPDLLTISFSGHDRIGHAFGADSQESLDEFLHLDRELARLLNGLDALVGKGKYVVVLSSDHGVMPLPEVSLARGVDAGRMDMKGLREKLDRELDERLGRQDWFLGSKVPGLTLNPKLRERALTQLERLRALARAHEGVEDLVLTSNPGGPWAALIKRGAYEGRSPDLYVVTRPNWAYGTVDRTGHSSPYLYDRAVPLVFFGAGVKKGQGGTTEVIHLAPTLAALLNVAPPAAAQGHVLEQFLP